MVKKKNIFLNRLSPRLVKHLLYILPFGWLITIAASLLEAYYYPGVLLKHFWVNPLVIYLGYGILGLLGLYGNEWKHIPIRLFQKVNYFASIFFGFGYAAFYFLEKIHYPNYIFSTFHIHPDHLAVPLLISIYSFIISSKNSLLLISKHREALFKWFPFVVILSWIIFKNFTDSGSYAAREIIFMINNPRATYDQKMELKVGKQFYNYVLFVKTNTPEDSTLLIPPFPAWQWAQTGNIPYMTYFLYPRTLLNGKEYTPGYDLKKDDIDFVLVAWGELPAPTGSLSGWPKFDVNAGKIIYLNPAGGIREEKGDYKYKELENKEAWGIIKVRK